MKTTMRYAIALMMMIGLGRFAIADETTTRPSTQDRIVNTIRNMGKGIGDGFTNVRLAFDDRIRAVKAATERSLQRPAIISCYYWPQGRRDDGRVPGLIIWMEERPSLKEFVVTNPETHKEQRVAIPQSVLDEALKTEMHVVVYGFFAWISPEVAGADPTQVLEVAAEGQKEPARWYPSTTMDPVKIEKLRANMPKGEPAHASTAPSTQESVVPGLPSTRQAPTTRMATGYDSTAGSLLYPVRVGEKWGCVDQRGRMVVPPLSDFRFDDDGFGQLWDQQTGACAIINRSGQVVLSSASDIARLGRGRFGVQDPAGILRFVGLAEPFHCDVRCKSAYDAGEGLIWVEIGDKWGCIDDTGKLVSPATFDVGELFHEGLAAALSGDQWGYIDHAGKWVIAPRDIGPGPFQEGLAAIKIARKGAATRVSKWPFLDLVEKDRLMRFIDRSGQQAIPTDYAEAQPFSEGVAAVRQEGSKWGYIDKSGRYVIPPKFDWAAPFHEDLANVGMVHDVAEQKSGYINHAGELVIEFSGEDTYQSSPFNNGRAWVQVSDRYGLIDKTGAWVWWTPKEKK